jgi:DNA-binding LacI/PurR family transcriptional regulator
MRSEEAATVKQVAEMAGCSARVAAAVLSPTQSTVRVGEATRARVLEAARETGYRPHLMARMMRQASRSRSAC